MRRNAIQWKEDWIIAVILGYDEVNYFMTDHMTLWKQLFVLHDDRMRYPLGYIAFIKNLKVTVTIVISNFEEGRESVL